MELSEAPAAIMSTRNTQKERFLSSCPMLSPSESSTMGSMGQVAKLTILYKGISAHRQARMRQFSSPKSAKNRVEPRITPTAPQQ